MLPRAKTLWWLALLAVAAAVGCGIWSRTPHLRIQIAGLQRAHGLADISESLIRDGYNKGWTHGVFYVVATNTGRVPVRILEDHGDYGADTLAFTLRSSEKMVERLRCSVTRTAGPLFTGQTLAPNESYVWKVHLYLLVWPALEGIRKPQEISIQAHYDPGEITAPLRLFNGVASSSAVKITLSR